LLRPARSGFVFWWAAAQRVPSCCSPLRAAFPADVSPPPRAAESAVCVRRWGVPAPWCWGDRCGLRVACAPFFPRALGLCRRCARSWAGAGLSFGLGGSFFCLWWWGLGPPAPPFVLGGVWALAASWPCWFGWAVVAGVGACCGFWRAAVPLLAVPPSALRSCFVGGGLGRFGVFLLCPSGGGGCFSLCVSRLGRGCSENIEKHCFLYVFRAQRAWWATQFL